MIHLWNLIHVRIMQVKARLAGLLGIAVETVETLAFQSQVVAGLNYKVHARINGSLDIIVTAFKPLPHLGAQLEIKTAVLGAAL